MVQENFTLTEDMKFGEAHAIAILAYSLMFVIGMITNFRALYTLLDERLNKGDKNRMTLLLIHLTLADLSVCKLKKKQLYSFPPVFYFSWMRLSINYYLVVDGLEMHECLPIFWIWNFSILRLSWYKFHWKLLGRQLSAGRICLCQNQSFWLKIIFINQINNILFVNTGCWKWWKKFENAWKRLK